MSAKSTSNQNPYIACDVQLFKIGEAVIMRLPLEVSAKLPSRGQVMVEGQINDLPFRAPFEPDGKGSHWLNLKEQVGDDGGSGPTLDPGIGMLKAGATAHVRFRSTKEWVEPTASKDMLSMLKKDPKVAALWENITPMARWEWVRWVRSTGRDETRQRRLEVALSKLQRGERRPCCWNRNLSTDPRLSKNGVLLDPTKKA